MNDVNRLRILQDVIVGSLWAAWHAQPDTRSHRESPVAHVTNRSGLKYHLILQSLLPGELAPKTKISTVMTVISVKVISGQKQCLIP